MSERSKCVSERSKGVSERSKGVLERSKRLSDYCKHASDWLMNNNFSRMEYISIHCWFTTDNRNTLFSIFYGYECPNGQNKEKWIDECGNKKILPLLLNAITYSDKKWKQMKHNGCLRF